MSLTFEEAMDLAGAFGDNATAIGDFWYSHYTKLSDDERINLQNAEQKLLALSNAMIQEAQRVNLLDAQTDLASLIAINHRTRNALARIASIKKALGISAALVGLAAAINSGQVIAIASGIEALDGAAKSA